MVPPVHNVSSSGWATITATALDVFIEPSARKPISRLKPLGWMAVLGIRSQVVHPWCSIYRLTLSILRAVGHKGLAHGHSRNDPAFSSALRVTFPGQATQQSADREALAERQPSCASSGFTLFAWGTATAVPTRCVRSLRRDCWTERLPGRDCCWVLLTGNGNGIAISQSGKTFQSR